LLLNSSNKTTGHKCHDISHKSCHKAGHTGCHIQLQPPSATQTTGKKQSMDHRKAPKYFDTSEKDSTISNLTKKLFKSSSSKMFRGKKSRVIDKKIV